MRLNFLILLSFFIHFFQLFGQTIDTLNLEEKKRIGLSDKIKETSGLVFFNNELWTINDSGGKPEIYNLDLSSGKINKTIKLENAQNIDWEDITYGNNLIYIADTGNNEGNRNLFTIYSVDLKNIHKTKITQSVKAKKLFFFYPEQKQEIIKTNPNTNFDCESIVYHNEKIHLFTKEWSSNKTTHYTIDPNIKHIQEAKKIESFEANGLITSATHHNNKLWLLGYNKEGLAFLWRFDINPKKNIMFQNPHKYILGLTPSLGQLEGITISNELMYIGGEELNYADFHFPQSLYIMNVSK